LFIAVSRGSSAGAVAAADAHFSGADSDDGEDAAADPDCDPWDGASQRSPDASHSPMFHQIEGLAVDANITFGDLKGRSIMP